ncbi:MAG TPA: MlaD family protein [Candidatus Acidoferrales bacterium]|nr:MlaD family protein [Candidatus Acidoferrales bacterium]
MDSRREQALVGLFVLIAIVVLVTTVFLLSGTFNSGDTPYRAYFKNAGGLEPGSLVRYAGGPPIGRVHSVKSDPQDSTRMEIDFVVHPDVPVKVDSKALITSTSPLADNYLGIVPGLAGSRKAVPHAQLQSIEYVGFADVLSVISDLGPSANDLVRNLNNRVVELKGTLNRVDDLLNAQNRANISASLGNVRGMLDENRPEIRDTLHNVSQDSEKLGPLIDSFQKAVSQANDTLTHLDATIGEDRPDIHQAVASLRQTLGSTATLADQLNRTANTNAENLDEILDNLQRITENLNSFTEEIKTHPTTLIRSSGPKPRKPGDPLPQ